MGRRRGPDEWEGIRKSNECEHDHNTLHTYMRWSRRKKRRRKSFIQKCHLTNGNAAWAFLRETCDPGLPGDDLDKLG